ncbi:phosphatase and actin regulator 2 [Trichonephila clavipes]|nr:phosphatase and actin regulator 2 [Trichonephila clavipes]
MYKNALKEDLIRVVEDLDGTVESTDTIVKLKTKIENSSTFESDPDFVKILIKNCIDERVSRNERDLEKQKIELAKLQLAKLEKEVELQTAKNKALSLNPAAKVEEKQFETLNKETATHISIREAEDWFRPIDFAKECDIYISSKSGSHKETPITYGYTEDPFKNRSQNFNPKIKENYPQYLEREKKLLYMRVYAEIKKLGHAKSDVVLSESESSLSADLGAYAYPSVVSVSNVSVSNVIENSSYDLPHVKNFNTRNDLSSLIKDYKCNKIKSTKLKLSIIREKCSDIVLSKKVNGAMKTSSVNFNTPSPMESKHRRFALLRKIFEPWQWKRRKKRNRFEQTSRTLERKISMRSTKDQLVKKDVLMPVKHNVFLWNLPDVEEVPSHDGETV